MVKTNRTIRRHGGFSLIELLLSLGLAALLLTFAMTYVVSLSNIWINRVDNDFFRQHADGVTLFLNQAMAKARPLAVAPKNEDRFENDQATPPPAENQPNNPDQAGASGDSAQQRPTKLEAVRWDRPAGYSSFDEPLLTFNLAEAPALLTPDGPPMPGLTASLFFKKGEGLALLWHSRLQIEDDLDDLHSTLISPYLIGIEYAYYDREEDRWETTDQPKENDTRQFILPQALKLTFEHQDERIVTAVYLPLTGQTAPLF